MFTNHKLFIKLLNGIVMILWLLPCSSQSSFNLVPNYSFETYTSCTGLYLNNAVPWYSLSSNNNSSNYGNACNLSSCCHVPYILNGLEYQYPRTGNAYAIMYFYNNSPLPNRRQYSGVQLKTSLQSGHCYYAEFFVVRYITANYSVNNIGLLFSDTIILQQSNGTFINANPQILNYHNPIISDTLNWVKISGIYIAQGGEKYITIGNFKDDSNTDTINTNVPGAFQRGAYFLDDVSVIPLDSINLKADAGSDTSIITGDSVFIGTLLGGTITTTWYNSAGQPIANNVPSLYVSPTQNTWYVLEQSLCDKVSRDTVYVSVQALPLRLISFDVQKHNDGNLLNWTTAQEINVSHFIIEKSNNGSRYTAIGAQDAGQSSYYFADKNLSTPISYYRLKMIDRDGKFTYSPVKSIKNSERETSTVYPNPSQHGIVTIAFKERGKKNITVTDVYGKMILQKSAENDQTIQLNITGVPGVYLVTITNTLDGKREVQKLIIQ